MTGEPISATDSGIYANLHLAQLRNGVLPIPPSIEKIVVEIGASDRDTLDAQLSTPGWNNTFLVTFEPLIDKYARGLARRAAYHGDAFQPLGHHHERGLILPFAVGPSDRPARVVTFNVGSNAGCSSLLPTKPRSSRLGWCKTVRERRDVPLVTLERILRWIGAPQRSVDFVKIDAQGVDLAAITSAGPLLRHVRSFTLEVPLKRPVFGSNTARPPTRTALASHLDCVFDTRPAGEFRPLPANVRRPAAVLRGHAESARVGLPAGASLSSVRPKV
jgi:FkbM family methyltransferase